ncbi:hypothetical protein EBR66_05825 [bacterium]|jgi:hypothetical protein|nr:hypothetical protein [bacterium]
MNIDSYSLFLIAAIAFLLLIADRILRINPLLAKEGFQVPGYPQQCGKEKEPCPFPTRCMNGFCYSSEHPQMYDRNPLPVVP